MGHARPARRVGPRAPRPHWRDRIATRAASSSPRRRSPRPTSTPPTFATSERRGELTAERDVGLAYNQFWWGPGECPTGGSSLIIDPPDGKIPERTAGAIARADVARAARSPDARIQKTQKTAGCGSAVCHAAPFGLGGVYNNNFQIFQSETHVGILLEMVHELRIIPLSGGSEPDETPSQWLGRSRGHWEGETLVVETKPLHGTSALAWFGRKPHPGRALLTARGQHPELRGHLLRPDDLGRRLDRDA